MLYDDENPKRLKESKFGDDEVDAFFRNPWGVFALNVFKMGRVFNITPKHEKHMKMIVFVSSDVLKGNIRCCNPSCYDLLCMYCKDHPRESSPLKQKPLSSAQVNSFIG